MATKSFHISFGLRAVIALLRAAENRGDKQDVVLRKNGSPMTFDEAYHEVYGLLVQGFKVLPACDNHDATGRCLGHVKKGD